MASTKTPQHAGHPAGTPPPNIGATEFGGYDELGQPMYKDTADGPQCTTCGEMNGQHDAKCPNGTAAPIASGKPPAIDWDHLAPAVVMPSRLAPGSVKVDAVGTTPEAIRLRAEDSLGINTARVAAKANSSAKRARVDYHWDVQPVTSVAMGEAFSAALGKYAKYRPSEGHVPFRKEGTPDGQVTARTGVTGYYRLMSDGTVTSCDAADDGAFLGIRYSVRPLEQRGDTKRLPGTA